MIYKPLDKTVASDRLPEPSPINSTPVNPVPEGDIMNVCRDGQALFF